MDFGRNLIAELDENKSKEIEQNELIRGQERMKRLGVWMVSAKELNKQMMKTVEDRFGINSLQHQKLIKFHGG